MDGDLSILRVMLSLRLIFLILSTGRVYKLDVRRRRDCNSGR